MGVRDYVAFSVRAVMSHRLRSFLSMLGIAIGIAAVTLVLCMGHGTRRYMFQEFTRVGTNQMMLFPGKTETGGLPQPGSSSTRRLTLEDIEALRRVPGVLHLAPQVEGQARVEGNGRSRSVKVFGTTSELIEVLNFSIGQGTFLPPGDPRRGRGVAVLGSSLKRELFGDRNALGEKIRAGGQRLRVIGVMKQKGRVLGNDYDDTLWVPIATAMRMFNTDQLSDCDIRIADADATPRVTEAIRTVLMRRHGGEEDFTITSQTTLLEVFNKVMNPVTAGIAAVGGVSLLVGLISVLSMMWISVNERIHEIGVLRALGATGAQVARVFLLDAALLTFAGALAGVSFAGLVILVVRMLLPGVPVTAPVPYVVGALLVSVLSGLLSGMLPAQRASRLDPAESLRAN
jgi:putative ABC transport system permease protein